MFDRDEPTRERQANILVKAVDNGKPQLESICMFTVVIEDINDNAPNFEKVVNYEII